MKIKAKYFLIGLLVIISLPLLYRLMHCAIDLEDETRGMTIVVHDETGDDLLAAEVDAQLVAA